MNDFFKIMLRAILLCLLWLQANKADDDFHTKFGEEIGANMRRISMNMFRANVESAEEFYKRLLMELQVDEQQTDKIITMLRDLNEMKVKIPKNLNDIDTKKMIELFRGFVIRHLMKIFHMESTDFATNNEQQAALSKAIGDFAELEGQAADKAIKELYEKWSELYKKIPPDEMQAHGEYAKINEAMEELSKIDRKRMKFPRERNDAFSEVFQQMANVFDWAEWKQFFEMNKN